MSSATKVKLTLDTGIHGGEQGHYEGRPTFRTDDFAMAHYKLRTAGVTFTAESAAGPYARAAIFEDSDGVDGGSAAGSRIVTTVPRGSFSSN